ncbi:hypothetical protein [Flexithrix dorotheae]|uniref:hypothetical protein n=1 Tax=Flexithrix dorotheae TaxID=70993 RepID=UPI000375C2E9|nr:hypothetical protein [Flexithrix dorotheae]
MPEKSIHKYFIIVLAIFAGIMLSSFRDGDLKPRVLIVGKKTSPCGEKGMTFEKAYVKSRIKNEEVEVVLFCQKYDGHWLKKTYKRLGSGEIPINMSSCEFTGNYYALVYYSSEGESGLNLKEISILHSSKGEKPNFKVTKREKISEQKGGGVKFIEGKVFTPKGEEVSITLFMEKKDGSWRKKHFNFVGSGKTKLNIEGNDLTGKYKFHITSLNENA